MEQSVPIPKKEKLPLPVVPVTQNPYGRQFQELNDPNDEVLTFSSVAEARERGLSLGPGFRAMTSKLDLNWRYRCKERGCPAKWSIREVDVQRRGDTSSATSPEEAIQSRSHHRWHGEIVHKFPPPLAGGLLY